MAKDDFDFDKMEWPDMDFGETQEPSDDRSPVSKIAKQTAKGAVKGVANEATIRRTVSKVLPKGHSDAADAAFQVKDLMGDTYSNLAAEANKTKTDLQRSLRNFKRQTKGLFPEDAFFNRMLKKLGGEDPSYYGNSQEDKNQREIDSTLLEVFGAQESQRTEERKEGAAKALRNEVLNQRRFGTQLQVLTSIDQGIRKVTDHNEVNMRFMKQQLKLQLQGNMMQADLIEQVGLMSKVMSEELKAVVKNTALPEASKINLSEDFKRVNAQRAMEKIGGRVFGGLGDYLATQGAGLSKRITNSVGGKLRDFRSNAAGGMDAVGDLIRMQLDAKADGGEDDTIESIMEMASGILMDKATNKWGGKIKGALGKTKFFGGSAGRVDNYMSQGARMLNYQAGLRGTHDGMSGQVLDFLRSVLDRSTLNSSTRGFTGIGDLEYDDPKMKRRGLMTVIKIIPGLLARIHHEAVINRTGDVTVPMIRYNQETGVFTDSRSATAAVREKLVSAGTGAINTEAVDRTMSSMMDTKSLTNSQKKALRDHIAHLNMRNLPFDPKAIAMGQMQIFGESSAEDKAAIRKAIGEQYGVNRLGEIAGDKDAYHQRVANSAKSIQSLRYNLKDPRKEILELVENGDTEELLALGVLKEQHGQLVIDFDRVNAMRFDDKLGEGASVGRGGYSTDAFRPGVRGGKTINNILNTTTSTNNLNSFRGMGGGMNKDDRYNSQYQTMALEEIVDVLKQGQTLSQTQMEALNTTIKDMNQDPQGERYNAEYQTMVLEEIMDILQDGRQFTNTDGTGGQPGMFQRGKTALGSFKKKMMGRVTGFKDMIKNNSFMGVATDLKNKVMGRFTKNKNWVKDKYKSVKDKATKRFEDVQDWYKNGEWRPSLEARKLAAKKYIDEKTGKVVDKLSDVKGNILELMEDGSTQIALYYEDMKEGIRTMGGRTYFAKKLSGVMDWVDGKLGNPLSRLKGFKDGVMSGPKAVLKWTKGKLMPLPDVYVKGETKPRLLAVLAKSGSYITVGGSKVRTISDITGPVADLIGNVLLDEEAIARGLVDANGDDLTRYAPGLKGLLQRALSAPGELIGKVKGMLSPKGIKRTVKKARVKMQRAFRGFGKLLSGLTGGIMGGLRSAWSSISSGADSTEEEHLNVAYAQLEVQGQILDQMVAQRKKSKKGKWDSDGDGIIDGSWRDLLARRKKKVEEKKAEASEPKESLWSKLKGFLGPALGMVVTAVTSLGGLIISGLSTLAGVLMGKKALGSFGDLLDRVTGGRNQRPGGRRPGGRRPPGRRGVPGKAPRGKWGLLAAGASMLGFSGMSFAGEDGGGAELSALDMVDGLSNTVRTTPKTTPNLSNSKSLIRAGTTAIRGGGWRALMNPYVLGGAVVAGSYLYYDASKKRPLRDARLTQYGVDLSNEDQADRYLAFEDWMLKQSGSVKAEDAFAAMEEHIGGVTANSQKSLNWYANRFLPVFTKWQAVAKEKDKLKSFADLDDVLTTSQAYTAYQSLRSVIEGVKHVSLAGNDRSLAGSKAIAKLAEIEEILKTAAGSVSEGAGDSASIMNAGLSQAAAMMKGDKEMMGGTMGKLAGFGMTINPFGTITKAITGFVTGAISQSNSAKAVGNFDKIKITTGPVDALRAIRMKVYGLTTLDVSLVNALLKLESDLIKDFTFSGKNTAIYRGKSQTAIEACAAQLGVNLKDPHQMASFNDWFTYRFLPSFSAYLGGAKEAGMGDPLLAHKTGSASQQYHAANTMVGASAWYKSQSLSVWKTGLTPVIGRSPNGDPSSVTGNMESLLAKASKKELSEISGEKGGIISGVQKAASSFMDKLSGVKNDLVKSATSWMPDSVGSKIKSFFGADGPSYGSGPAPNTPTSTLNQPGGGGSYTPSIGGGQSVNFDPAGGKYGNVADIPMPTGPKGFEHHMALIKAVSEMTGVDPGVLSGLFATESSFDSRAVPGTSSAKGIGQFTNTTWASMVKNYGHLFGIKEGTSPNDPRANALMSVMYMKENAGEIKKFKKDGEITDVDLYLAHFLGAHGYKTLYKNPTALAAKLLPASAESNASIFYVGGDRSRPRTAAEVMQIQANKQIKNRNHYTPLIYSYIKENGGKVPSAPPSQGGLSIDQTALGGSEKTATGPTDVANVPGSKPSSADKPSASGFTPDMLRVTAGGIPTGDGATKPVTAAGATMAAAQAGSDVALPPASKSPGSGFSPVKDNSTPTPQQQPNIVLDNKAPEELVTIGMDTNSLLSVIAKGIDALVKQTGQQNQQRQVSARPSGPMSVNKPSSV